MVNKSKNVKERDNNRDNRDKGIKDKMKEHGTRAHQHAIGRRVGWQDVLGPAHYFALSTSTSTTVFPSKEGNSTNYVVGKSRNNAGKRPRSTSTALIESEYNNKLGNYEYEKAGVRHDVVKMQKI